MEKKKRVVISLNNISSEIQNAILKKYPYGYADYIFKVSKSENDFFHAITVDTDDASYLIKVPVKIDAKPKDKNDLDELLGRPRIIDDDEKDDNSVDPVDIKDDLADESTIED